MASIVVTSASDQGWELRDNPDHRPYGGVPR